MCLPLPRFGDLGAGIFEIMKLDLCTLVTLVFNFFGVPKGLPCLRKFFSTVSQDIIKLGMPVFVAYKGFAGFREQWIIAKGFEFRESLCGVPNKK